jgi:hypothetical protein
MPSAVSQQLHAYTLHYLHQRQVQLQALRAILTAYQDAGIPALVLKGAVPQYSPLSPARSAPHA